MRVVRQLGRIVALAYRSNEWHGQWHSDIQRRDQQRRHSKGRADDWRPGGPRESGGSDGRLLLFRQPLDDPHGRYRLYRYFGVGDNIGNVRVDRHY